MIKILFIIVTIIFSVFAHELGHYLVARYYGYKPKLKIGVKSSCTLNDDEYKEIYTKKLYFCGGIIGNIICFLLGLIFNINFALFNLSIVLGNLILIFPNFDIYYILGVDKIINEEHNNYDNLLAYSTMLLLILQSFNIIILIRGVF